VLPSSIRSFLDEPAVPDPPRRVSRDVPLVAVAAIAAVLEGALRTDADWRSISAGWQIASVVVLLATLPLLLVRRSRPLLATVVSFSVTMGFSTLVHVTQGVVGGLTTSAVMLVSLYALFRWGSGRHVLWGGAVALGIGMVGIINDPGTVGEAIGGFVVLTIPMEAGLIVRYRAAARERAIAEVTSRERVELARELHDTVAHHVSAIAVQAQAGRALAASDPARALAVLAVIEEEASRTLAEMRAMVGTLRAGAEAELVPRQGIADLPRLAQVAAGQIEVAVEVEPELAGSGALVPAVDSAVFRIAQESVTNAIRHARRASSVRVRVAPAGERVRLEVTDDGDVHGALDGPPNGLGFGLLGMAERAHLLGGTLTAGPIGSRGWQVVAELPRDGMST
jgi:signal transduction histidine kinase